MLAIQSASIGERTIGADTDRRMAWYPFVACIPGGIVGLLFEHKVQTSSISCPYLNPP